MEEPITINGYINRKNFCYPVNKINESAQKNVFRPDNINLSFKRMNAKFVTKKSAVVNS